MAASAIVASGTAETASADITLAAGIGATISLFAAGGTVPARAYAQLRVKSSTGDYIMFDTLSADRPAVHVDGPLVFQVLRRACATAFGVDQS